MIQVAYLQLHQPCSPALTSGLTKGRTLPRGESFRAMHNALVRNRSA